MPNRAADDFTIIRERLEELKKERKEAEENKSTEGKTDEQLHQEIYGDYCNGNSTEHTVGLSKDKWIAVIDPETGEKKWEAIKGWNGYYYDSLILDEEDNVNYYVIDDVREYYNHVKYLPNRVLP